MLWGRRVGVEEAELFVGFLGCSEAFRFLVGGYGGRICSFWREESAFGVVFFIFYSVGSLVFREVLLEYWFENLFRFFFYLSGFVVR